MTQASLSPDPRTRLALGCSALARAGQQLSVATTLEQAKESLRRVADQLQSDRNLASLMATDEITKRCRDLAGLSDLAQVLGGCRQIATGLARQASTLAAEVQQRAAAAPKPAPAEVSQPVAPVAPPTPTPLILTAAAPSPSAPVEVPAPAPSAVTPIEREPEPVRPAPAAPRPRVDPAHVRRIVIAQTEEERLAVASALDAGKRFAGVVNGTLIDLRTGLMWSGRLAPGMGHAAATQFAQDNRDGGYADWRLPRPQELGALLGEGGLQALRAQGVLPATGGVLLWSSEVRYRFLGFIKEALAANSGTGNLVPQSLRNRRVQAILARG